MQFNIEIYNSVDENNIRTYYNNENIEEYFEQHELEDALAQIKAKIVEFLFPLSHNLIVKRKK